MRWLVRVCLDHEEVLHDHDLVGTRHGPVGSALLDFQYIHYLHMPQPLVCVARRKWIRRILGVDWQRQRLGNPRELHIPRKRNS